MYRGHRRVHLHVTSRHGMSGRPVVKLVNQSVMTNCCIVVCLGRFAGAHLIKLLQVGC